MVEKRMSYAKSPFKDQSNDNDTNPLESIVVHGSSSSDSHINEENSISVASQATRDIDVREDLSQPFVDMTGGGDQFQAFSQVKADTAFIAGEPLAISRPNSPCDITSTTYSKDIDNIIELTQTVATIKNIAADMFEHSEGDENIETVYVTRQGIVPDRPASSLISDFVNERDPFLSTQKPTPASTQGPLPWPQSWNINIDAIERILRHEDINSLYQLPLSSQTSNNSILQELPQSHNNEHKTIRYDSDYKFSLYSDEFGLIQAHSFERLSDTTGSNAFLETLGSEQFWLDISCPKGADINILSKIFNIHPLTIEDIQDLDPREKCELFEAYIFLCIGTCDYETVSSTNLDYIYLFVIVFSNCIISIHHKPVPHIRRVLKRIVRSKLRISSDWVMYALLDDTVDLFMPIIKKIEFEVDSIDDLVLFLNENDQKDMLRRIGHARKMVSSMLKLLTPKTEIIKMLVKRHANRLNTNTIVYLRDIQDHVLTMGQSLDHFGESLNRSHSNYLAQISIELTQASNRMNHVMKTLTVWAAFSMPLTLYAGIMGMNVPVPGQKGIDSPSDFIPFFIILASMILIVVAIFFIYKKYNKYG